MARIDRMPSTYEEVWVLPFKSQEFMHGPELRQTVAELRLRMDHEREDGAYEWSALVFGGVHAYKFTGYESCSRDQVRAYDRLVRVHTSEWLTILATAESELIHFRIYFDEFGCYDIAATGVEVREED